jgi:hypothetical protein
MTKFSDPYLRESIKQVITPSIKAQTALQTREMKTVFW